jgi:hypothetical protein
MTVLFIWYTLAENIYLRSDALVRYDKEAKSAGNGEKDGGKRKNHEREHHGLPKCILSFKHVSDRGYGSSACPRRSYSTPCR